MLAFDWLASTNRQNWVQYFPCENDLCRAMLPDCLGTLSSSLCQISVLKEAIGQYVYDNTIFLKWVISNVPFCSIFVPFHFYLIIYVYICVCASQQFIGKHLQFQWDKLLLTKRNLLGRFKISTLANRKQSPKSRQQGS